MIITNVITGPGKHYWHGEKDGETSSASSAFPMDRQAKYVCVNTTRPELGSKAGQGVNFIASSHVVNKRPGKLAKLSAEMETTFQVFSKNAVCSNNR